MSTFFRLQRFVATPLSTASPKTWLNCFITVALTILFASVAHAAQLQIAEGAVVKFGTGAELVARDGLRLDGPVVFTSINDGTAGGVTVTNAPVPLAGDWKGITLARGALVSEVILNSAEIRYAGGAQAAALTVSSLPFQFDGLTLRNNLLALSVTQGANVLIRESRIINNSVGMRTDSAPVRLEGSEISGNTVFGVQNLTPTTVVVARGNWWGHPSGPNDAVGNPNGQGNAVSAGVDYGQYLAALPLVRCSVRAANGVYTVTRRQVELALQCRNASEFRLSESASFSGGFLPMSVLTDYVLSANPGSKIVFAQFRGTAGQAVVVQTPQPFIYAPIVPTVSFQEPAENAVLTGNTLLKATASDVTGVLEVEFRANTTLIGTDNSAPYEMAWNVSTFADGNYTLSAIARNTDGNSATATRAVRLARTNPQPDSYTFLEGDVLFVDAPGVLANDQAGAAQGLQIEVTQQPGWGTLNITNDGAFVFRPDTVDRSGVTSFSYRLRIGALVTSSVAVNLTVTAVNDAPVPLADGYVADENVELRIVAPGVLDNDRDVDSTAIAARLVTTTQHGVLTLRPDGSFDYVPEVNYRGTDQFSYEARDLEGASAVANVEILVSQPPTATNDVYLLDVNEFLQVTNPIDGIVANDLDQPENDILRASVVTPPANGVLSLQENGTFSYRPNLGFQGLDPFSYRVSDGQSNSNIATVTLAVGVTGLPRAFADTYQGLEDQELVVSAAQGLLINDTDQDTPRAQLQAFLVRFSDRQVHSISVNLDGSFRVRPVNNFNGETIFQYEIYDGTNRSNVANVTVDFSLVNDGVEANDDVYGVRQNQILVVPAYRGVPRNDKYDDDFVVRYERIGALPRGDVTLLANGDLTYVPPPGFSGFDEFSYRLYQVSTGIQDTALVRIRTNAAPVAGPDTYVVDEDMNTIVSPSLLANDTDSDGDTLSLIGAAYGYFVNIFWNAASNPSITRITSFEHFYGMRVVSYTVSDGIDSTNGFATVTVRPVPEAPIAGTDLYLTQRNTTLRVSLADGVIRNDFEPDARQYPGASPWEAAQAIDLVPFELQLLNQPANGQVTLEPDGSFVYVPRQNYSGLDEFRYTLRDATGRLSDPGIVRIRVNTPPTPVTDSYTVNEDTRLTVPATQGLLVNDTDVDGDLLFASCVGGDSCISQLNIRADGGFVYNPPLNFYGTKVFQYRSEDPYRGFGIGTLTITVLPVNDAPVPEPDTYRIDEDNPLTVPASLGILFNDDEVDGERLVGAVVVRVPQSGAVLLQTDGRFAYTPNANSFGRETFRYRVFDESGLFAEAEVEILVDAVNDAPRAVSDSYSVDQDQRLEVNAANGVLRNDSDVDSPNLSATLLTPAQHGTISLQTNGAFSYQPNGIFAGIDRFQYQLSDGAGGIASATALINVRDLDDPIEISMTDDFFTVTGASLSVDAPGVLANDTVTGAPSLSAALVSQPAQGLVSMATNGGFVYTAPAGFVGSTSFTYAASAGNTSELGLVTLNVSNTGNQPPVATNEQFGMFEDGVLDSNSAGGLLVNDRDPDGSPLSLVMEVQPLHGRLDVQPNGQFVYTPVLNFNGSDLFRYHVTDGTLSSNVATATIAVVSQNDAPVALADAYQVMRDQSLNVTAPGVLSNDSDLDGDALSVELVDAPMRGQLTMAANGGFSYQPLPGVSGMDSFRYAVTDGAARALAEVMITITTTANRAPIAQGESYTFAEDQTLTSLAPATRQTTGAQVARLIANDSDPDGDPLSVQVIVQPEHGSLTIDGPDFRYQPGANYFGTDRFSYRVSDGALSSQTVQTQLVITSVNDAPSAQADLYLMTQGGTLNVPAAEGVLANDRDIELQPLTAVVQTAPNHGSLSLQPSGAFLYTPSANFFGRDEFEYQVSDGGAQALGRVAIDVTAQLNQRPIAIGESFVIVEDSVLDTTQLDSLLINDRDPEGAPLTLRISKAPARGVLRQLSGGHIRYEPARNDNGTITFDYVVNDGVLDSLPARVQIQLLPQNDAPMALADVYNLLPSVASLALTPAQGVISNDVDPDGDTLVSTVVQAPASGALNLALNGSLLYTPTTPRPQSTSFRYRVRDVLGLESSATVTINFGGAPAEVIFRNGFEGTP